MRVRLGRRELIGVIALLALVPPLLTFVALPPLVRSLASRAAARRRLDLTVGEVLPGWFAVRLRQVKVQPHGLASVRLDVVEVRVGLTTLLHASRVDLSGALVILTGSPESLRDDFERWHSSRSDDVGEARTSVPIEAAAVTVRWVDPNNSETGGALRDVAVSRGSLGTRVAVAGGELRLGQFQISLDRGVAEASPKGALLRARAVGLSIGWTGTADPMAASAPLSSSPPMTAIPPSRVAHAGQRAAAKAPPTGKNDAALPLVPLPNLHLLRDTVSEVTRALSGRFDPGADVAIDALTWSMKQRPDRVALTFGPGPLAVTRTPSQLDLRYSSDRRVASTALELHLLLPTDGGDLIFTVAGGPVALSLLGVKEGAAGLADTSHATIVGRARVVLSGDGASVTFDADAGARGVSLNDPKLALDTVRGVDATLRVAGAISSAEVRVDDFAATLGSLRISASGLLEQTPDHVAGSARLEMPPAACQSLLASLPIALLPALDGTKMTGKFGAHLRFAFDTRSLDDLELKYETQNGCRVIDAPPALDHDRFTRPFQHRIYLPDGSMTDEVTGPGTSNWTPLDQISPYMQIAVLTTEDAAFPKHHGFNAAAIRASLIANLKARRFVRGASTITMQLAKNLFLSRDKTLSRKLEEVILTDYLEQTFTKDELMELYLNVIEFGPEVYGITAAAEYYFARTPAELDLAECLFLSSLLPAPLRYSAMSAGAQPPQGWMRALHGLMEVERRRGLITDAELAEGEAEEVLFWHGEGRPPPRRVVRARSRVSADDADLPDPFESPPE